MELFADIIGSIRGFFEAGGPVLYGILVVTVLMWTFIVERFWYFRSVLPQQVRETREEWDARPERRSWQAAKIRSQLISEVSVEARRFLPVIETLMQILPLLGLLGTVWGMIQVFDVMTVFGTGNARLMAGGVSQATIPTMAGLVASLSGLYLNTYLKHRAKVEVERVGDMLARQYD